MRVALGSDHAGFQLKECIKAYLAEIGIEARDFGTNSPDSVDYPDFAQKVALEVKDGKADRGILVCGAGVGMSIAANKIRGIRAALAFSDEIARLSRFHNDANVLCLPGRFMDFPTASRIVRLWLETPFEGGRHQRRVEKIAALERE